MPHLRHLSDTMIMVKHFICCVVAPCRSRGKVGRGRTNLRDLNTSGHLKVHHILVCAGIYYYIFVCLECPIGSYSVLCFGPAPSAPLLYFGAEGRAACIAFL